MASINILIIFCVYIFVITCNGGSVKKISRKKCEEYGNIIKPNTCIESSRNGSTAKSGDYPHMAIIGYESDRKVIWNCAGSLISDQYILTASHCVTNIFFIPTIVRLGELNLKSDQDNIHIQDNKITKIIVHPDYKNGSLYNDIALIKLEKPIFFNQYVRPACLPDVDEDFSNQKIETSGWGLLPSKFSEQKPYLLYDKNIVTIPYETCKKSYTKHNGLEYGIKQNNHLCIQLPVNVCQIISGSSVEIKDHRCMHKIIGFLQFTNHICEPNIPAVTTKISSYTDWIEKIVWD